MLTATPPLDQCDEILPVSGGRVNKLLLIFAWNIAELFNWLKLHGILLEMMQLSPH